MENNEENTNQEGEVVVNAEIAGTENNQENQINNDAPVAFDDQLKNWAKENGREVDDVKDLLKPLEVEKEVIKEVNPWADVVDAEDEAYFKFKKETKLGRKEFESLSVNVDELDPLEVAREQARRDIGVSTLNPELADQFIADKLGIHLDDLKDLSEYDKVKLLGYGKPVRDEKKSQQEQYRKPVENKTVPQEQSAQPEYITLPNGAVMRKADYEAAETAQQKEKELAVQAVKTVTAATFKMPVDDNGSVTDVTIPYEYHEKDSQKMESIVSDVYGTIEKRYRSEDKQTFNHAAFAEDMLWSDKEFREKTISDLAVKVRAQAIEETLKGIGNHNFNPDKPLDKQQKEGVRAMSFQDIAKRI